MKVLIVGAYGQLGNDLCATKPGLVDLMAMKREEFDLTNSEQIHQVLATKKPDLVINSGAFVQTSQCEVEPEKAFLVNAIGVRNLAISCRELGILLAGISTDFVFDGKKKEAYHEEDFPRPLSTYGLSKYGGEIYMQSLLEKYYIFRVASLYGKAGASGKGGNFVYTVLKKAKGGETLKMVQDIVMSPSYTVDVAKAIWKILLAKKDFGVFHVANSGHCSWFQFCQKILELTKHTNQVVPVSIHDFPSKMQPPMWSPLVSQRGISLPSWEEGIQSFLEEIELK